MVIMKKIVIAIVMVIILIIILAFIFRPESNLPKPIAINTENQPVLGRKDAKINIVAFEDLKCAACKEFSNTIFPILKQKYIDTGIANFTFINLAFVPNSLPAANAAHCLYVQNPKFFFPFVEYVYANQPPEEENWATIPKLAEFAGHVKGADLSKLSQCIYDSPYNALFEKNFALAEQAIGTPVMTPSVFINGIKVDPVTMAQIDKIINHIKK